MATLGTSGHGPAGLGQAWHPHMWRRARDYFVDAFKSEALRRGRLLVFTGVEPGSELIMAWAALVARRQGAAIDVVAVVPYPRHHKDVKVPATLELYEKVLERATRLHVVSDEDPRSHRESEEMKDAAREYVVDHVKELWTIWDMASVGRAYHAVTYAEQQRVVVINHWDVVARHMKLTRAKPEIALLRRGF